MASTIILFPLLVLLAAILPGVNMLPIASLAVVPFWAGAVVPYTKGNVIKTVIVTYALCHPLHVLLNNGWWILKRKPIDDGPV
jgi:galactitol-specific phosphotransferase system IIC component